MLLAIDTSAGSSVAVVRADAGGERVLAQLSVDDSRRHAELVGGLIAGCLAEAKLAAGEIEAVAVGMGPGPFTGLRVGIAAATTFAFALGVPVLHVASHDAIALELLSSEPTPVLVTTDARRRERYWSTYSGLDSAGIPVRVEGPAVAPLAGVDELATVSPVTTPEGYARHDATRVSAAWLGVLASRIRKHGREFAGPEPLYLRSPDVTVPGATKRVTDKRASA